MFKVVPVKKEDFDQIYPLFQQIPAPIPIPRQMWQNLFNPQWECQLEPLGYVLRKQDAIVGYIGLITVQRPIGGQRHEIINLTSWTVDKHCGGHAIEMLSPFIQDAQKTLICFTPAKSVSLIFRRFGFQELNAFLKIIPFWDMSLGPKDYKISFNIDEDRQLLTNADWQIYCDHRKLAREHFIIKNSRDYCYVVAKRVLKKGLPFLHVHYVSNKKIFVRGIRKFAGRICYRFRILGLLIFEHYLGHEKLLGALRVEMSSKALFRSPHLQPEDIDSLYSEFFVLNF